MNACWAWYSSFFGRLLLSDTSNTATKPVFFWVFHCDTPLTTLIQSRIQRVFLCQLCTQSLGNQLQSNDRVLHPSISNTFSAENDSGHETAHFSKLVSPLCVVSLQNMLLQLRFRANIVCATSSAQLLVFDAPRNFQVNLYRRKNSVFYPACHLLDWT